ncbi:hypothetical protein Dimus_003226, partial [Dionaea muscipula]
GRVEFKRRRSLEPLNGRGIQIEGEVLGRDDAKDGVDPTNVVPGPTTTVRKETCPYGKDKIPWVN